LLYINLNQFIIQRNLLMALEKIKKLLKIIINLWHLRKKIFFYYYLRLIIFKKRRIKKYYNIHRGATIFCLGAGPSLKNEELRLLDNQVVILTNSAYEVLGEINPSIVYHAMQDNRRIEQIMPKLDYKDFECVFKSLSFIPKSFNELKNNIQQKDVFLQPKIRINLKKGIFDYDIMKTEIRLDKDFGNNFYLAPSVIFMAIQLALYMGASRIVLLGVDMSYGNSAKDSYYGEIAEQLKHIQGTENGYLQHSRPTFISYKKLAESSGVDLLNATKNTREDVLNKIALNKINNYNSQ
jgi:hypothetical protein